MSVADLRASGRDLETGTPTVIRVRPLNVAGGRNARLVLFPKRASRPDHGRHGRRLDASQRLSASGGVVRPSLAYQETVALGFRRGRVQRRHLTHGCCGGPAGMDACYNILPTGPPYIEPVGQRVGSVRASRRATRRDLDRGPGRRVGSARVDALGWLRESVITTSEGAWGGTLFRTGTCGFRSRWSTSLARGRGCVAILGATTARRADGDVGVSGVANTADQSSTGFA